MAIGPRGGEGRRRVVIEGVRPQVDAGRFPIKRVVGDTVNVDADIFVRRSLLRCSESPRASHRAFRKLAATVAIGLPADSLSTARSVGEGASRPIQAGSGPSAR